MTREGGEGSRAESFCDYAGDSEGLARQYEKLNDPAEYVVGPGLRQAVNVALILGQPLVVTGDPGTGKTQLGRRIAHELGLPADLFPLTFITKSTSAAKDLFYQYDALGHFHDTQLLRGEGQRLDVRNYITFEALGKAILLSLPREDERRRRVNDYLPEKVRDIYSSRAVVLIDEIDKAPRDLPNDVLDEIESMSFTVRELMDEDGKKPGLTFRADQRHRPIVLITSNSERDLPDAFLRRCIYYNIEFPDEAVMTRIVRGRLGVEFLTEEMLENAVRLFLKIRCLPGLKRAPATGELLSWLRVLEKWSLDVTERKMAGDLKGTYSALAKEVDDLRLIQGVSDGLVEKIRAESLAIATREGDALAR